MNIRKIFACLLTFTLSMGLLSGCGGPGSSASDGLEWIDDPSSWEEYMNNAKIKSLTSLGNTLRLKNAIDKARSGKDVNVCYIGGSITEGDHLDTCYANRSFNYFKDTFGKGKGDNVHYFNAGISGTPSNLGALRFEKDVLSNQPDIVFIEFAVNDGDDDDTRAAYESMILDALNYESKPAVILLFARMREGWTSQGWKKEIGAYYDLPMISYADGITYLLDEGAMKWEDFSNDYTHPHADGNAIVAEMIAYFFDEADRTAAPEAETEIPAENMYTASYFRGAHMLEKANAEPKETGSWRKGSSGFHYEDGWIKQYSEENDPLVFEFEGKSAYVVYPAKGETTFTKLVCDVYFNGELVGTKTFDEHVADGWGCPYTGVLHRSFNSGSYRLEFHAEAGSEKSDLQLLAVAYTD